MKSVKVIKLGGGIIDSENFYSFLRAFATLDGPKVLVHGGGNVATKIGEALCLVEHKVNGRRVTDGATLDLVVMVYAGLINKKIVAYLQGQGCNALGLCGADANVLPATRRNAYPLDYGFVGDLDANKVGSEPLLKLLNLGHTLVVSPITHDGEGQLLNTNADTVAAALAIMLSRSMDVFLYYCFEKDGVFDKMGHVLNRLSFDLYEQLVINGTVSAGMIPKLENAFNASRAGVKEVRVMNCLRVGDLAAGLSGGTFIE